VNAVAVTYGAHPEQGLRAYSPLACVPTVDSLKQWLATNA
jgi:hypothetical protein